ncbi:MAG: hypothetical protein R3A80_05675 [Bdellovibrionota bacterium]
MSKIKHLTLLALLCGPHLKAHTCRDALSTPQKPNPEFFDYLTSPHLGISFVASADRKQNASLLLETNESIEISKQLGMVVYFRADFEITPHASIIGIPFRSMTLSSVDGTPIDKEALIHPEQAGFKILKITQVPGQNIEIKNNKVEMLPILDSEALLETQVEDLNLATYYFTRGAYPKASVPSADLERISAVITQGFHNLEDPALQERALEIIAAGEDAINKELNKYGFKIGRTLYEGNVPQKQWAHEMSQKEKVDAGKDIDFYPLAVEHGDFAAIHGAYSHHALFIAFFSKMNPDDIHFFVEELMKRQRSNDSRDWYTWVILFDGDNSNSPISPGYWANRIRNYKTTAVNE